MADEIYYDDYAVIDELADTARCEELSRKRTDSIRITVTVREHATILAALQYLHHELMKGLEQLPPHVRALFDDPGGSEFDCDSVRDLAQRVRKHAQRLHNTSMVNNATDASSLNNFFAAEAGY